MYAETITVDGNEAAARIAYLASEVIAIYPITPASAMGESADAWAAAGQPNLFGAVPQVVEMQSEGGAAGAVHGALQAGALTTTFTASQGLLLMIPNLYKIAGELTPAVIHVAARALATHALSIFGDHSDVMAARQTGWALLCASSVQEAQDFALVAHAATLEARVPFLHFFDGFRTSHELARIDQISEATCRAMLRDDLIAAHRGRALSPDHPVLRGSAQNPDVFFQAREACNPFYKATPAIVQRAFDALRVHTGRSYHLFDYVGDPEAERVLVVMGSAAGAATEAVEALCARGEKVGLVIVRLYRPFDVDAFLATLPPTTRWVAVLDRTKEPGAPAEPLHLDVSFALGRWGEARGERPTPRVVGGRYGLSSKETTPAMIAAVFANLTMPRPRDGFTVGIVDDVTHLSLPWDVDFDTERDDVTRAVFYGLGSDGTVSSVKNTVKILGEQTPLFAQGYFVYDSKKSGSVTVSHLRVGPRPIASSYLIRHPDFIACHDKSFLSRPDLLDMLAGATPGATFLLNCPWGPDEVWDHLPSEVQATLVRLGLNLWVVDATQVATRAGLGRHINTVMQACFFHLAKMLPPGEAIGHIKRSIEKTWKKRGEAILRLNFAAVDAALEGLHPVVVEGRPVSLPSPRPELSAGAPDFVKQVTRILMDGRGDHLPVSAMPVDGTFPTGTAQYEKRSIALEIPIWDPDICTQCGLCAIGCPHAAIRTKAFPAAALEGAPEGFLSRPWRGKDLPEGTHLTVQVAPDDCTGCGVCVDICPARSKEVAKHKAIEMAPKDDHLEVERARFAFFDRLPTPSAAEVHLDTVKGSQLVTPLFEYSGACGGCGETPYLKLLTQLFGDRLMVANATGCSSIFGGNLPTTPWSKNAAGRGPAWANSLFEDNAEFGLGMRLALDTQRSTARALVRTLADHLPAGLADTLLGAPHQGPADHDAQRARVAELKEHLKGLADPSAERLLTVCDALVERSVWIVGGDGWAYDIGFGGLDHVLGSGRNVNVLVLDTEVYSNTGGQASKATARGAVAKFAAGGKPNGKKDLGMEALAWGDVYVAQVALGANPRQTLKAMLEAEAWPGPSLIIAYSTCIAHGIDMTRAQSHMAEAVKSGYWPLYRYLPQEEAEGTPFHLDSNKPSLAFADFAAQEARYALLARSRPEEAKRLMALAQRDIDERWHYYEQLAGIHRTVPHEEHGP